MLVAKAAEEERVDWAGFLNEVSPVGSFTQLHEGFMEVLHEVYLSNDSQYLNLLYPAVISIGFERTNLPFGRGLFRLLFSHVHRNSQRTPEQLGSFLRSG